MRASKYWNNFEKLNEISKHWQNIENKSRSYQISAATKKIQKHQLSKIYTTNKRTNAGNTSHKLQEILCKCCYDKHQHCWSKNLKNKQKKNKQNKHPRRTTNSLEKAGISMPSSYITLSQEIINKSPFNKKSPFQYKGNINQYR